MTTAAELSQAELDSIAVQEKLHIFDIDTDVNLNPPLDKLPRLSDAVRTALNDQRENPDEVVKRPALKQVQTDPSRPYTDYLISSSHNTYLLTAQILGKSSSEAYTHVLNRGCRCVEIDVWPSSDGPVVKHGFALCGSVPFRDVCKAIGAYMDKTYGPYQPTGGHFSRNYSPAYFSLSTASTLDLQDNIHEKLHPQRACGTAAQSGSEQDRATLDFPLFISLENHVPPEGQAEMVKIMKECIGPRLVDGQIGGVDDERISPKQMRGRVLTMVEYYPPLVTRSNTMDSTTGAKKKKWWTWGGADAEVEAADDGAQSSDDEETVSLDDQGGKDAWPGRKRGSEDDKPPPPCDKISDELAALGYYARSIKPAKGWLNEVFTDPAHVLINISESTCIALLSAIAQHITHPTHGEDHESHEHKHSHTLHLPSQLASLIHHSAHNLRRIFPKGTRVSSANLDPSQFWRTGSQVVSLNWQKYDRGMQMNESLFVGTPGWVLKPDLLMRKEGAGPEAYLAPEGRKVKLRGVIVGASSLPAPNGQSGASFHTYLKSELYYHRDTTPTLLQRMEALNTGNSEDTASTQGKPSLEAIRLKHRTKSRRITHDPTNGADVIWNEVFEFEYEQEDLAFLRLLIYEDEFGKDDRVASFCAPVNRLVMDQWVTIRMLNPKGKDVGATVLAKFSMKEL